ncbi:phage tail termination protein [Mycolicibacterium llatzerense]|uniref:phage tail termination protein n=1 Tax=Mycolicibacterium llatzerense TaxID=280871 RepID=UPI0021B55093|nr:hypothetical protein [Mycolicibacterium llatzerense]MCT7361292.1 hypothetical protein [Mycolicibacterium llatzerense]
MIPWLPAWYQPGLASAEDAVKSLFQPLFPTGVPGAVEVINELPDGVLDTGWFGRMLYIARSGGAANVRRDQAPVQIAAITTSRSDSLVLSGFVRDVLVPLEENVEVELSSDGRIVTIVGVEEISGPEEIPGQEYDERIIPSTYLFTFDNPLATPDYSDHLGV